MRDGHPIDSDVLFIVESNEFLAGELRAVVCDDGVRYSEAMDDVKEEQHSSIRLDRKCIGRLVEAPWDVIDFEAIELVFQSSDFLVVHSHLGVMAA